MENENKETDISLSLDMSFEEDKSFDSDRFMKLKLKLAHDGENTHCFIDKNAIENAKDTVYNIPILAKVYIDENNQPQFSGHDFTYVKDYNNKTRRFYIETPIGVIPENSEYWIEEENGVSYAYTYCYIWKYYSNYAEDIIMRDSSVNLSMEIKILDFTKTDTLDKFGKQKLNVTSYKYRGVTLLGNDRTPAMGNTVADLVDFEDTTKYCNERLVALMDELKDCLNYMSTKGGNNQMNENAEGNVNFQAGENNHQEPQTQEPEGVAITEPTEPVSNDGDNGQTTEPVTNEPVQEDNSNGEGQNQKPTEPQQQDGEDGKNIQFSTYRNTLSSLNKALRESSRYSNEDYIHLIDADESYAYYSVEKYNHKSGCFERETYRQKYEIVEDQINLLEEKEQCVNVLLTLADYEVYKAANNELVRLKEFEANVIEQKHLDELDKTYAKFEDKLKDCKEFEDIKNDKSLSCEEVEDKCYQLFGRLEFEAKQIKNEPQTKGKNQEDNVVKLNFSTCGNEPVSNEDDIKDDGYGGLLSKFY